MEAHHFARKCLEATRGVLEHKTTVGILAAVAIATTPFADGPNDEVAYAQQAPAYDLPNPGAGLAVDIGKPATSVYAGLPISYNVKLTNSGPNSTADNIVAVAPPSGYEGTISSTSTTCAKKESIFICPVTSLKTGSEIVFKLRGMTNVTGSQQTKSVVYDAAGASVASDSQKMIIQKRPNCGGKLATMIGTARSDRLLGTNRSDVIAGLGGGDYISSGGGNDIICGNKGDDELVGGSGTDRINGGTGADWCQYGESTDNCEANRSLRAISGSSRKQGKGRLLTYRVMIERGIATSGKAVAQEIDTILGDKRGWTRSGKVAFQRVASNASTQIILATPSKVDALCAPLQTRGRVSCRQGNRVILNLNRWRYSVEHWPKNSVNTYRQMLVNHETGHRLGFGHSTCTGAGNRAPVMQQQTKFLLGCRANPWPLTGEIAGL